jgi:hypothetical protein
MASLRSIPRRRFSRGRWKAWLDRLNQTPDDQEIHLKKGIRKFRNELEDKELSTMASKRPDPEKRFKTALVSDVLSEFTVLRWHDKQYQIVDIVTDSGHDEYALIARGRSMYDALHDAYKRQGKPYTEEEMKR